MAKTPEEIKAKELVDKITKTIWETGNTVSKPMIKEVALLTCDKILNEYNFTHIGYGKNVIGGLQKARIKKWTAIKKEIEKL